MQELDDLLTELRRMWRHPGRRASFLTELDVPIGLHVMRTMRAIDFSARDNLVENEHEGPSVSQVAEGLGVDVSTASRLVDQVVAAGFAIRTPSRIDRRRSALVMTPEGTSVLSRAQAARQRLLAHITAEWPQEDLDQFLSLLSRFRHDLDRVDSETLYAEP